MCVGISEEKYRNDVTYTLYLSRISNLSKIFFLNYIVSIKLNLGSRVN